MTVTTLGYTMVICGNADDPQHRYRGRIEKVKFGVPIQEAFAHDIPATLLVLLLKVNKDGPSKKDIWRAPGNQAQVRKLSHIMQHGRLVNIANFSVYTAASVIKKFLSKLPGGIFGLENEQTLFDLFSQADAEKQRQIFCRVVYSLSVPSQHLLVLLFGTFYMISESSDVYGTKMTPDAIGISVAPSLFHTCIHDGQRAKMEDVMRFKIASEVISKIIESFGYANLFPRECYEFYARITGRTLRVDDNDSRFRFAPPTIFPQSDAEHDVLIFGAPMRLDDGGRYDCGCESGPSSSLRQPTVTYHRLSSSAGEVQVQSDFEEEEHRSLKKDRLGQSLESTHSLTYLEWVHERQTRRMRTRSEWFLSPALPTKNGVSSKPTDFECGVASTSKHHAMFDDDFMSSIEDITDMRSAVADSPQFSPTRQPLQPLRLQGEQISTHTSSPRSVEQRSEGNAIKSSRNVIRRRSWRTHYVRPNNRSSPEANEDGSSRSTPVHRRCMTSLQSASMPCSRRVSGGALAASLTASSITDKVLARSISRSDEESAKKSSTHRKFVHF